MPIQNSEFLILAAPALAWTAGMGLFKTLLILLIIHHWVPNGTFTGTMSFVGHPIGFYIICALGALEMIIDMIPRADVWWDRWTVHLRLIGGVVLGFIILETETLDTQIMMAIFGIMLTVLAYVAKTAARRAAIQSGTAPFVAPVSSITENCLIVSTLAPLTRLPPLTILLLLFMALAAIIVIYIVRQEARQAFQWLFKFQWTPVPPKEPAHQPAD